MAGGSNPYFGMSNVVAPDNLSFFDKILQDPLKAISNFGGDIGSFLEDNSGTLADIGSFGNDLMSAITGFAGVGQAEDQAKFTKRAFNTQLQNQANLTNERLATRFHSRQQRGAPGFGSGTTLADYMSQFGQSGKVGGTYG